PSRSELVADVHDRVIRDLDVRALEALPAASRRAHLEASVSAVLAGMGAAVAGVTRREIIEAVANEILGLGPVQPLLDDPDVSEIMVNGPDEVYFERDGVLYVSDVHFRDAAHVQRIADRIVAPLGRR